jgi:hypothetical protein
MCITNFRALVARFDAAVGVDFEVYVPNFFAAAY